MPFLAWLAEVAAKPVVANLLWPALSDALGKFFHSCANRIEEKAAYRSAKAAKTSEELREASKKLSAATRRD